MNKHICESTRELAKDLRDVTKVLGSGQRGRVAEHLDRRVW